MIWIFFKFLRLDIDTSQLAFSILMVSSATFISELPALRGLTNRSFEEV